MNQKPDVRLIEIDVAKDATIQQFMNIFVEDPVIRLDLEQMLADAARVNPLISSDELAQFGSFAELYNDPKYVGLRSLIKHAANAAVLGMLQVYRELRGETV